MKFLLILISCGLGFFYFDYGSEEYSCMGELPLVLDTIPTVNIDSLGSLEKLEVVYIMPQAKNCKVALKELKSPQAIDGILGNCHNDKSAPVVFNCMSSFVDLSIPVKIKTDDITPRRAVYNEEHLHVETFPFLDENQGTIGEVTVNECYGYVAPDMQVPAAEVIVTETEPSGPIAGILTASEWNDLTNWEDWKALTEDGVYTKMLDYWNLPMGRRQSVFVTNQKNIPLPNCELSLVSDNGKILWTSLTDHQGRAELWFPTKAQEQITLIANSYDAAVSLSLPADELSADQHLVLETDCNSYETVDIMFVVDATGSMDDEIAYLKAELADVIGRASESNEMEFRTGAVFYKDKWDDYLTAVSPLHHDPQVAIDFMHKRSISGGGDYPEAVDAGLEKALNQDWDEEALSRIIFLLLDAPPHDDPEVLARLEDQVRTAAENGIKIIPITASGIDRETEYLMKQLAMMTNGTYVFLTDDSGIGESHLTHAIPDYDVELLNALLVRLISGYAQGASCDSVAADSVAVSKDREEELSVQLYPNPAVDRLQLNLSSVIDKVIITTSTGRRVQLESGLSRGTHTIDVSSLVSGKYYLTVVKAGKEVKSIPFLIIS